MLSLGCSFVHVVTSACDEGLYVCEATALRTAIVQYVVPLAVNSADVGIPSISEVVSNAEIADFTRQQPSRVTACRSNPLCVMDSATIFTNPM